MRTQHFEPVFAAHVPRDLEDGKLYVSTEYATAVHLCACGCGTKTVTPLSPDGWTLTFDGAVTLRPSVGNGQAPCHSHYLINRDAVRWLPPMGREATRAAISRDRHDTITTNAHRESESRWSRLIGLMRRGHQRHI
jgi:hypothetical protein